MEWSFNENNYLEYLHIFNGISIEFNVLRSHVYNCCVVYFLPFTKMDLSFYPFKISKELHPIHCIPYYYVHPCSKLEDTERIAQWLRPFGLKFESNDDLLRIHSSSDPVEM